MSKSSNRFVVEKPSFNISTSSKVFGCALLTAFFLYWANVSLLDGNQDSVVTSTSFYSGQISRMLLASSSDKASLQMKAFKERIMKMDTEELVEEGIDLLNNFGDPFSDGGMTIKEKALLATIEANSSSVFEWGMGSSTVLAASMKIKRLSSIDSVREWVQDCADNIGENNLVMENL